MAPIALQLYSVREECAKDFRCTVKKVADMGYKGVELAGLYDMTPKDAKAMFDDLGLEVTSGHGPLPTPDNVGQIIDDCKTMGQSYLITGFGPDDMKTIDQIKACAAKFQAGAEQLRGSGIQLGFHNHWWEFEPVEGRIPHDILMAEAPDVFAQIDVYWTTYAGADPIEALRQKGSRAPLLHIKDGMLQKGVYVHTAVGKGKLNMPGIIGAADKNALKWLIVELDACETDMVEAVADSYAYLVGNGLAEGNR